MSNYSIDQFNFEFWQGSPPTVPSTKMVVTRRPGVSGVSHHILGTWGDTFEATLTSHYASQILALQAYTLMLALIGTGGKFLKYNNLNFSGLYGTVYHVNNVELTSLRSVPRLIGPGYDFTGGAILVTKFTLTPQKV